MSGDPVSQRTRSAIRTCHIAAAILAGIALIATFYGFVPVAIIALSLATLAQIFASDVMRVIILLFREYRR
ncbi:hypothetical protein [Sphingomonas sp. CFBP 8760]|uniref:hypothetical protein n=1 Tax=Sphingomonas sp. CFBP 8760 TaxID=2775282 RepID=UPI00177AA9E5|nr:hypothetical protein [Sphingomonas sp. CFBP 8760]MBD8548032.1 hypothetical protein [Sphingomonas sp. CFBP 8760]